MRSTAVADDDRNGRAKYLLIFLCLAFSLAWLVNKNALFDGLEYTVDVFINLQNARSLFVGDGFLHDYFQGGQKGIHNDFVLLLLGPLTLVWGSKAFFGATALLQAGASARLAAPAERGSLLKTSSVIAAMLFGPLIFWTIDNPFYGWEPELIYPFLAVLLAEALLRRRKTVWLWAALIVLCREEGALLAGGIFVIALAHERAPARRMLRAYTMWLLVFLSSMLLLRLLHRPGAEDHLKTALQGLVNMRQDHALLTDFSTSVFSACAMFVAGWIPLFALGGKRLAGWATLVSLPLWGVIAIGTLAYARQSAGLQLHGLLWPPRFALMWAVLAAGCVFALASPEASRRFAAVACALLSIVLQWQLLRYFRDYSVAARIAMISPTVGDRLTPRSLAFARCLGHALPRQTVVQPHWNLEAVFEKQLIVPDKHMVPRATDIFVCDREGRLPLPGQACLGQLSDSSREGYLAGEVDGIEFAANPVLRPIIDACLATAKSQGL